MKNKILSVVFFLSVAINIALGYYVVNKWFFLKGETQTEAYKKSVERYKNYPVNEKDVVLLGDSRIQGLNPELLKDYFPIVNRGIVGDETGALLKRVDGIIAGKPKKIIIEIGVNDLCVRTSTDSIIANFQLLLNKIRRTSPNTQVYFMSVIPFNKNANRYYIKPLVAELNTKTKAFCLENKLTYIDIYNEFSIDGLLKQEYDTGDGMHLNITGNKVLAKCIIPYL